MSELLSPTSNNGSDLSPTHSKNDSIPPPALPPRRGPPELPPKSKATLAAGISYSIKDPVSLICFIRQLEDYLLPRMVESSDLFTVTSINIDTLNDKISQINQEKFDDNARFWYDILVNYVSFVHSREIDTLESHLMQKIPNNLRGLVYFKVLQIRYSLHNESFDQLLARAKSSQDPAVENLSVETKIKDVLRVFSYYNSEILSVKYDNMNDNAAYGPQSIAPQSFIINVGKIVGQIEDLQSEQVLFILLKINRIFINLIRNEFFYKINRSLEELQPDIFLHITKQGINMNSIYKKLVYTFFDERIEPENLLTILDFFIFEGFDFILRLVVWSFEQNKAKILELEGDELNEFLYSVDFFKQLQINFEDILKVSPAIIKFENEFHLIHANSLNNNNNELTNLREGNEELELKIKQVKLDLQNLETTHKEILEQSDEFKSHLSKAHERNDELTATRDKLQERYENLSMKENLNNTIKANKEFATRNKELQKQIDDLKREISSKSEILKKN